jgi:hypothetical protein
MPPGLCSRPVTAEETVRSVRHRYRDAVRLSAREEILAELAGDSVTARLHADTARFHHGSAHAYAQVLQFLADEVHDVHHDKQQLRRATREADLAPMRCQGRRYRAFDPAKLRGSERP